MMNEAEYRAMEGERLVYEANQEVALLRSIVRKSDGSVLYMNLTDDERAALVRALTTQEMTESTNEHIVGW